ncbi:MAG: hypothetical protein RMM17_05740 [Acidobacteriota bacterium]|nr:hypothetical protein [Blastocatellia bacterium]MDW8412168.1 hypothetical protein [Acidobacteriota bacterium]
MSDKTKDSCAILDASRTLYWLNFRRRWRLGDQFCVLDEREILYHTYKPGRIYLIDLEMLILMEEFLRQGVPLEGELEAMVFIPKVEDVFEFCKSKKWQLSIELSYGEDGETRYSARLSSKVLEKDISVETKLSMRLASILILGVALQSFIEHPDFQTICV